MTLLIVIIMIVVVAVVLAVALMRRRAAYQATGPEYDRLRREMGPRRAKAEFARRRQRVAGLGIKPLGDNRRAAYEAQWTATQEDFIESPSKATRSAGSLVTAVAAERGYPVDDENQFLTDLSVYHGRPLDGYRQARKLTEQADVVNTELLRKAVLHHRAMFQDLLESTDDSSDQPQTTKNMAAARPGQ